MSAIATKFTPATPSLTLSAVNVIFSSPYGFISVPSATVVGPFRGRYASKRISGIVQATTQDVVVSLQSLTAAGTWLAAVKSQTVTAGTPQPIDWLAPTGDWQLICTNGGTGPSALSFDGFELIHDRTPGA